MTAFLVMTALFVGSALGAMLVLWLLGRTVKAARTAAQSARRVWEVSDSE